MERKWSLVEGGEEGEENRQTGLLLAGEGGGVQSPETSIEDEEGFNSTLKSTGGK